MLWDKQTNVESTETTLDLGDDFEHVECDKTDFSCQCTADNVIRLITMSPTPSYMTNIQVNLC